MPLKIEKDPRGRRMVVRPIGKLRSEHLGALREQMEADRWRVVLNLDAVTLVDVEAARFLNACEESGIELLNCWPYIREWMLREESR